MSFGNINPEFLIALVESRPALWDKSFESVTPQRTSAWKDICSVLNPDFNTFSKTKQLAYVTFIIKKWANIRDAWKKSVTDVKRKGYKHAARLKFLEKNLKQEKNKKILSSSITISENDSDTDSGNSKNSDNIKEEEGKRGNEQPIQVENEVNTIQFMDVKPIDENNCPHISFVKGLLPILNKLGEDEVLEFQMGVIQLLQGIRRRSMAVNQMSRQRYDMPSSSFDLSHLKEDREQEVLKSYDITIG